MTLIVCTNNTLLQFDLSDANVHDKSGQRRSAVPTDVYTNNRTYKTQLKFYLRDANIRNDPGPSRPAVTMGVYTNNTVFCYSCTVYKTQRSREQPPSLQATDRYYDYQEWYSLVFGLFQVLYCSQNSSVSCWIPDLIINKQVLVFKQSSTQNRSCMGPEAG